jgi:hypothetical protein
MNQVCNSDVGSDMEAVLRTALSRAIPVVYVLIGIREICQTQLNICYYMLLYSFIEATCFTVSKGHHQAVDEVFIKS